ncbi:ArnT family glycosyltransferase [Armatimonas sp.]|uniref:ArnT family glycosyltransferase n=1 Tax=Armatimonas sp. TaxID=1872638 RepID=UPI003751A568
MTRTTRSALLLIGALTLFRLFYGAQLGLAWDEAYYWQWSRHLDLSYYDQGPGIAYCIKLGTLLAGHTHLGVRLMPIVFAALGSWLTFLTARRWLGEAVAWWMLVLLSLAPLYAAGSLLATYDSPLVVCWALALWLLTKALQENKPALWYAVGVSVALGIASKLTMLMLAPGVLLFLALVPDYRKWLRTPHPYLAFGIALLGILPYALWDRQHEQMFSLHIQTLSRRHTDAAFGRWFLDFLGGQALFVGLIAWLAELWCLVKLKAIICDEKSRAFVLAFTLPLLAVCIWTSLRSKLEINWPTTMHLASLLPVAVLFERLWRDGRKALPLASMALNVFLCLLAFFPGAPGKLGLTLPAQPFTKLNEPYGWPELMAQTAAAGETLKAEGREVAYASVTYRVNSAMAFYLPGQPQTNGLYFNVRWDNYRLWTDQKALIGKSIVLVNDVDDEKESLPVARKYFASVEPLKPILLTRPGYNGPVKQWYITLCRDFKGYDPSAHRKGY